MLFSCRARRPGHSVSMSTTPWKRYLLYLMALFYAGAGLMHFIQPDYYARIMPPFFPPAWVSPLVILSGLAEIVLGLALLLKRTRRLAAWGIIALLLAVFPANIYHYTSGGAGMDIPGWVLLIRLPLQGLLIYWAYVYTRPVLKPEKDSTNPG